MGTTQRRAIYEIQVEGQLDEGWQPWLHGLAISASRARDGTWVTQLRGKVPDQAALRGLLGRLWDLNLTLIAVRRIEQDDHEGGK